MKDDGISEARLIELGNYLRFAPTERYHCPQCGGPVLQDNWPPDYAGGTMSPARIEAHANVKHVCLACRINFRVRWSRIFEAGHAHESFEFADIVPLVERDGHLLTAHDVRVFAHFAEHGVWPKGAYP